MNYRPLLINDTRQILKDPMLMASLLGPLALIAIVRFLFPYLGHWIELRTSVNLTNYDDFVVTFLLVVIQLLLGTMAGLLMLDERDENIIAYYAVTPLARQGYISYRLYFPSIICVGLSSLFIFLSGITELSLASAYTIFLLALETPCIALFLVVFASNKVEGLALSKLCGLLFAGPILVSFAPEPWKYLGVWLPTFWPTITYTSSISNEPIEALIYFVIGFIYHLLLLKWLVRTFQKLID